MSDFGGEQTAAAAMLLAGGAVAMRVLQWCAEKILGTHKPQARDDNLVKAVLDLTSAVTTFQASVTALQGTVTQMRVAQERADEETHRRLEEIRFQLPRDAGR